MFVIEIKNKDGNIKYLSYKGEKYTYVDSISDAYKADSIKMANMVAKLATLFDTEYSIGRI